MRQARELLNEAAGKLASVEIAFPRLEAEVLLAAALKEDRAHLLLDPGRLVAAAARTAFRRNLRRRLAREPAARITGVQEFWSLPFRVGPSTLVPRPDSETLIQEALARIGDERREHPLRLLDLGTGSGCLLLALLSELPNATGMGADVSVGALTIAEVNARALGLSRRVSFARLDWMKPLPKGFGRCDMILCNPPYVPTGEIEKLAPEVAAFEPRAALDGGSDGLDHFRAVIRILPALASTKGAIVIFEVGQGQAEEVTALLRNAGAMDIRTRPDLAGIERAVSARIEPVEKP